jgi:hypothetical protein
VSVSEGVKDVGPKYMGNVLSAFEAGAQLDLRVKLALEFLKSPLFSDALQSGVPSSEPSVVVVDTRGLAEIALDLATDLLELGAERGLVCDLPDHGELSARMKHHIERSVAAGSFQAIESQRAARTAGPMLAPHFNG